MNDVLTQRLAEARARRRLPSPAARRRIRMLSGLSQSQLAAAMVAEGCPVSRVAVALWELGKTTPRGATAIAYLKLLNRLARDAQVA